MKGLDQREGSAGKSVTRSNDGKSPPKNRHPHNFTRSAFGSYIARRLASAATLLPAISTA